MQNWLDANQRQKRTTTDEWYLGFANRLQILLSNSVEGRSEHADLINDLPIRCAMYLQDVISQSGGWKAFSELYYSKDNAYLPFYPITTEYVQDEINKEDIAFILWLLFTGNKEKEEVTPIIDPLSSDLIELSEKIYALMDELFEEAPVSDVSSPNDWVLPDKIFDVHSTSLPEIKAEQATNKDVKESLLYNNDYPLLYFATYKELEKFLTETLCWENQNGGLFKELEEHTHFVVYANAKGILLAPNISQYFNDSHNPTFNKEEAQRNGYRIFCVQGECPFDLIKYGMAKGLLPDIELPIPNGKELLHKNWDFIARYYLREYYEGV